MSLLVVSEAQWSTDYREIKQKKIVWRKCCPKKYLTMRSSQEKVLKRNEQDTSHLQAICVLRAYRSDGNRRDSLVSLDGPTHRTPFPMGLNREIAMRFKEGPPRNCEFYEILKITKIVNFGKNRGMRFNLNLNLKLKTWIEPKSSVNASLGWDFLKFTRSFLSTYFSFLQLTSYFFIEVN